MKLTYQKPETQTNIVFGREDIMEYKMGSSTTFTTVDLIQAKDRGFSEEELESLESSEKISLW